MIAITGSTGLVGSHLLFALVSKGYKVRALKRSSSSMDAVKAVFAYYTDDAATLFENIAWIDCDMDDPMGLAEAFSGIEKVYHTAAYVSFDRAEKQKVLDTNIHGTTNVVNACLVNNVKKLCFVSSIAAIGNPSDNEPATEEMIWSPSKSKSTYTISKFHSEMEVWRGIEEGLNAVIVNPSVILGPGNWTRGSSALFTTIHKGLLFYPPGNTGYVDVRDVVKAMIVLMDSDISNERFIISNCELSYKELFTSIAKDLGVKEARLALPRWLGELAWRLEWLKALITGKKQRITHDIISAAFHTRAYSNRKIKEKTGFEFIPIHQTMKEFAGMFLADKNKH